MKINIFSLWNILFDPYKLSTWCARYIYKDMDFIKSGDNRLKRWIAHFNHVPIFFEYKECGYIYETPQGVKIGQRSRIE